MGTLINLFLLTIAVGLVSSKYLFPVSDTVDDGSVCSSVCTEGIANGEVKFDENIKYGYEFTGKTTIISPTNTQEGVSEVFIRGKANVIGLKSCGAILYLKNVEIIQGTKIYGNTKLEGFPILFSYNKGKVSPNICSLEKDSVASMNLKRAIVSAFQVSSVQQENAELFETDVLGTCATTYTASSLNNHINVKKIKDLTKCTEHEKINLSELSSPQLNPVYRDSPFSVASQNSITTIIDSTIKSVASQEIYLYQPLSAVDAVTKIIVNTKLDLKKRSMVHPPSLSLNKGRSIIFDKQNPIVSSVSTDELVEATQLATINVEPIVEMDGAKYFANLISLLKVAKKDDILVAFSQIKSGSGVDDSDVAKMVFLNALFDANCGESIEAVVALIRDNEISDSMATAWFTNLGNAQRPTREAVVSASNLLKQKVLKESYLGVGSLLRQYLKNSQDFNSPEVYDSLHNIGAPLQKATDNSLSSEDEDLAIASLKGLGNAQYISDDQEEIITQIITDKTVKQRIRAAALDMVKVYANNPKVEKSCENVFVDENEDSEIRIKAFKVFAMNPSNHKANIIKNVLDNKRCQLQIQAYLLSYLSNLQINPDESKLDQRAFYEGIKSISPKKMLSDALRFSQNMQYFHQCPLLHSGFLFDGDVIYSQKSFLARSSSVSLNTAVFGRKHNIFDLDVRVENIEPILEKLFGPQGYFDRSNENMYSDVKNYINQAVQYAKTRSLNTNPGSEMSSEEYNNDISKDDMKKINIDFALKLFGNDFGWFTFQGRENEITYQHIIDAILKNFENSTPNTKDLELNIRKQIPIADYEKTYATISGLPITLKIQATSAIKLNIATKFDLEQYMLHPENSNFALKLVPSGSITFNTLLTVDGFAVEVGQKVSSSVHTSTGSDFSFKTFHGHGFEIIYGLPLKTMDVLSMKSGAFATVQEKGGSLHEIPLTTDVERMTYTRSFENMDHSLGLSLLVDVDIPWNGQYQSLLPFSGPSSLSLKVLKVDENLSKYVVRGSYDLKSPKRKFVKFIFGTPEADVNRNVQLFIGYDTRSKATFVAQFITPSSKLGFQSTITDTDEQKTLEIKCSDGAEHFFTVGVKCEHENDDVTKFYPIFEAEYSKEVKGIRSKHPRMPIFDIEGYVLLQRNLDSLDSQESSKYSLKDMALVTPECKHSLQGSITVEDNGISGDTSFSNGKVTVKTNGFIMADSTIFKLGGNINLNKNKDVERALVTDENDDEYEANSKFLALLHRVKSFNASTYQELHTNPPYAFISNNYVRWDDDHFELHGDILMKNEGLQMTGSISTSNLLDLVLDANITVQPRNEERGLFFEGILQHSFNSDPTNTGHGNFKYIQNKDEKGSYFEFNSECPLILGVFHFNTKHELTDEQFMYTLHYDVHDNTYLVAEINIIPDDIHFIIDFESPDYKSYVILHGWSEEENTYSFDTELLWPGPENTNYMKANGTMLLDGRSSSMNGYIDFPIGNLKKVNVTLKSKPISNSIDEGIAEVFYVSDKKVVLFEKFKYKFQLNDGELYLSGESIDEGLQKYSPITFGFNYGNFVGIDKSTGKHISYLLKLENNEQMRSYERSIKVTKSLLIYSQIHQIDNDKQTISLNFNYDFKDAQHWTYNLTYNVISPNAFHYLTYDDHNYIEYTSFVNVSDYSINSDHSLNIYSEEGLVDAYELRYLINQEKAAAKIIFGQREIRLKASYDLNSIEGGYRGHYFGQLWLDYEADQESESTLTIDTYYSFIDGLSSGLDFKVNVPTFNEKEMSINTDLQVLKSWENPLSVKLDLNIFPTTEQTLHLNTNLKRTLQNDGSLYSAELSAKSDGMELNYFFRDAIFVSPEKWGKYIDGYFIDSENIKRPLQLHFELLPKTFINKLNVFDITVINIESSINASDGVLDINLLVGYNDHPYKFGVSLTAHPSFQYTMQWNDKMGNAEGLQIDGSVTMDDSAVISATRIKNNGEEVVPVGFAKKSLEEKDWWATDNQMNMNQWNSIWQSLKGEFIERFINVHGNFKNIIAVAKSQRAVRMHEARRAISQHHAFIEYARDETQEIFDEILNDDYILEFPFIIVNGTKALFFDVIDFIEYSNLIQKFKNLGKKFDYYLREVYHYYLEQTRLFVDQMLRGYDELLTQVELAVIDLICMLDKFTDKPINDASSKPRSLKEYTDGFMNKAMDTVNELKNAIDHIQEIVENYIRKSPIHDLVHDQIEMLKTYPYKERLCEEIHNYLVELEETAPTKDLASFIKVLDSYLNKVIHGIPVDNRDIITLRNKGFIVAKSLIFDFSEYVKYDKAMNVYNSLSKLTNIAKTVLYIISPDSFQHTNDGQNIWSGVSEHMQLYQKYLNPTSLLPPFKAQGVVIDSTNIITYNSQPYSFTPNTGSYILAKDLANNKFSIIASYDDNTLSSISLIIDNIETYILLPGGRIIYNNKDVGFPLINDNVQTRKDVYSFGIQANVGVNIKCTLNFDVIEVFVNGYYFGKVYGLLGAMNQEPTLDFTMSNGKPADEMQSFLMSYRSAGSDEPTVVDSVYTDQNPCPTLFSGVSSLKSAFPTISPNAYRMICNQLVSTAETQQDAIDKGCLVARSYVSMARENFLPSCSIPEMCITSTVNERALDATSTIQISEPSDAADIVILFEETISNQKPFTDVLKPFMVKMNQDFNNKGIYKVKFIVIGFSGKPSDSEVHIYTTNSDNQYEAILINEPDASSASTDENTDGEKQKLSSQFMQSFKKVMGENSKDRAYRITADYPYTANSVKMVLSVSHSLYTQSSLDVSVYAFDYITSCYTQQGIKFYLVAPLNMVDSTDEGIFGADGVNTIYTMSSPKGKEITSDEYTYNKSLETSLVIKTGGVMYDSQAFVDGTGAQKKTFLLSLCKAAVDRAVIDSNVMKICSSSVYNGVMPYAKCTLATE